MGALYTSAHILPSISHRFITLFYATTLSTNLSATTLLAYRLWIIDRRVSHLRATKGPLLPLLAIVLDSGILYSVTLLVALCTFLAGFISSYIILDMVNFLDCLAEVEMPAHISRQIVPVISIAFYMIIIRVELSKIRNNSRGLSTHSGLPKSSPAVLANHLQYPMDFVQVHVTTSSETDDEQRFSSLNAKSSLQEEMLVRQ